jgi:uncharacterized protein (TIGR03437 family)
MRTFTTSALIHTIAPALFVVLTATSAAQISPSAYRVLGQADMTGSGLNMVQGFGLNNPGGVALDAREGKVHIYVADTNNHRVLAWDDIGSYQTGDDPSFVLGQRGSQYSSPFGIGYKGFYAPVGLAVDPSTGDLYVADTGNSRILRFPAPFSNPQRIEPDAVIGQPSFTKVSASPASASTLKKPMFLTFDSAGNLWVADTGNNRALRFAAAQLKAAVPGADTVLGQSDFVSGSANQGKSAPSASSLNAPTGVRVDSLNSVYIADYGNARVLRFTAPALGDPGPAATAIWGQATFTARVLPPKPTDSSLAGPMGLTLNKTGSRLYVAVPLDNRVLEFPTASSGSAATVAFGQPNLTTNTSNTGAFPNASPNTLAGPSDVAMDAGGNLFITDTANNRMVQVPAVPTAAAVRVWGQLDFTSTGANRVKPCSIGVPHSIAIDYSQQPIALYVSDTSNNRVLIWRDAAHFHSGDPADLVIGQPTLWTSGANAESGAAQTPTRTTLAAPTGLAVDQKDGTLYVADAGNHRILRYPRPVSQAGRITPDAVIGQPDFTANLPAGASATSLNSPGGLTIGPNGNLFVADTGNNRVLEYAAGAGYGAAAIRVYGQPAMLSSSRPTKVTAQTLASPRHVAVDSAANLYVTDSGTNRVLIYPNTPSAPNADVSAAYVIGHSSFTVASSGGAGALKAPVGVGIDSNGSIYVADTGNNRVLVYPSIIELPASGGTARAVIGQENANGTAANWDSSSGQATANGLYAPLGLSIDRQDTLYIGDAGNSRLVHFLRSMAVVNAATLQAGAPVAPGAVATMGGRALAAESEVAPGTAWPDVLQNRQVVVDDDLIAPLYFIAPNQVNLQIPCALQAGSHRIAIRIAGTGEFVAGGPLPIAAAAPGLFTTSQSGSGQVAAVNQEGSINSSSNPARAGSTIVLYGTGQGPVTPAVPDGMPAPASPLSNTMAVPTSDGKTCLTNHQSVCVAIGSAFGNVQYSGLAPGFVGLWQINVTIPPGTPPGNASLRVVINGTPSNVVTVAVAK